MPPAAADLVSKLPPPTSFSVSDICGIIYVVTFIVTNCVCLAILTILPTLTVNFYVGVIR